jgi:hypothetical protein
MKAGGLLVDEGVGIMGKGKHNYWGCDMGKLKCM